MIRPRMSAGAAGWPGIRFSTSRDSTAAMIARRARRSGRPRRIRDGSSARSATGSPRGRPVSGIERDGGQRLGVGLAVVVQAVVAGGPGLLNQVGVGLGPGPGGAQLGERGGGLGVAGQVPAIGPVRVGRDGDRSPGGVDLLVGQVAAGGQTEDLERVRLGAHRRSPGPKMSSRPAAGGQDGGTGSWRGSGTRAGGSGAAGGGSRVSGDAAGRATWTNVAAPRWM